MRHILLLISVAGLIVMSCSDSTPTKPVAEESYKLYFWDEGDHKQYYSYDPVENRIDSLWLPYRSVCAKVSPEGRRVWTRTFEGGVVAMDIEKQEVEYQFPANEYLEVVVSPDGRLAAFLGYNLEIVSTSDFAVLYSDTVNCSKGRFTQGGTGFYYLSNGLWRLDLENGFEAEFIDFGPNGNGGLRYVLPNRDESKLYLLFWGSIGQLLAEYHPETDSIIRIDTLYNSLHELGLTKDDQYLFVTTNPPSIIQDFSPEFALQVYDTETKEAIWEQGFLLDLPDSNTIKIAPTDLVITPDFKWAVMLSRAYDGRLIRIDLEKMAADWAYIPGTGHQFQYLSCSLNVN